VVEGLLMAMDFEMDAAMAAATSAGVLAVVEEVVKVLGVEVGGL